MRIEACPFCGKEDTYPTSNRHSSHFVECGECGASGPSTASESLAIELWNKRK